MRARVNVLLLGIVSFLNDMSSEMIMPILPKFISMLGGSYYEIGLIGGLRDSITSILKVVSGYLSDKIGHRKVFVFIGYTFSAFFKMLLSFSSAWQHVLAFTSAERVGKGLRTAPRDAIIAESMPKERGTGFGIHRAMDTAGAVVGVLLAFVLFWMLHLQIPHIIFIAALIAFASLVPLIPVKESPTKPSKTPSASAAPARTTSPHSTSRDGTDSQHEHQHTQAQHSHRNPENPEDALPEDTQDASERTPETASPAPSRPTDFITTMRRLPKPLKTFIIIACVFSLANFSYMFFIYITMNTIERALPEISAIEDTSLAIVILLYMIFNIFYAILATPFGMLADKFGKDRVILIGYLLFSLTCIGFAATQMITMPTSYEFPVFFSLFAAYGTVFAMIEGTQRAFVSDLSGDAFRATALGAYHTVVGIAALPASVIAGFLGEISSLYVFLYGGIVSFAAFLLFIFLRERFHHLSV